MSKKGNSREAYPNSCKDIVVLFQHKRSGLMFPPRENGQDIAAGLVCRDSCECLSVFQFGTNEFFSITQPLQTLASWNARTIRRVHLHKDSELLGQHTVLCGVLRLARNSSTNCAFLQR